MADSKNQTLKKPDLKTSPHDASAQNAMSDEEWPRFSWPHMYLAAFGLAISLYAFLIHQKIKAGGASGCGFSQTINCDKVLASQYGAIWGIPLGAFGMAYFITVILSAVTTNRATTLQQETSQRLFVSALGMGATIVLSAISYGILRTACPICMATHLVILLTFGVSVWQFLNVRKDANLNS